MPPQFANTPEALLGRNDSKNPSTTCKGITSAGRPCRRALASPRNSPIGKRKSGVVAVTEEDGQVEADFYCWQHKDQAREIADKPPPKDGKDRKRRDTQLYPLQERSSIDTLVERLGIESSVVGSIKAPRRKRRPEAAGRPSEAAGTHHSRPSRHDNDHPDRRPNPPQQKKSSFWSSLCCMSSPKDDDDYVEIVRHRRRVAEQPPRPETALAPHSSLPWTVPNQTRPPTSDRRQSRPALAPPNTTPSSLNRSNSSQATQLLSLIPPHLSPQTTSALLAELIKPISPTDEDGYIYIFWLTPQNTAAPSESTARSLLTPPTHTRPATDRSLSDVITEFSHSGSANQPSANASSNSRSSSNAGVKKTLMLKIGRASNVTRRMNEWQRQCGYKLNLVRWYPHVPSSASPTPPSPLPSPVRVRPSRQPAPPIRTPDLALPGPSASSTPTSGSRRVSDADAGVRRVRCVKRVERLVHLELADRRVLRDCEACGKEHREWFAVEASTAGVRGVDECVRRWVGWAAGQAAI